MVEAAKVGLRERKKNAARDLIVKQSNRLFQRHGYDAVTLEQIADRCDVSVRTILRYFNTKEALALAPEHAAQDRFAASLAARETDATNCWRAFVSETVDQMMVDADASRRRMHAIMAHPALHGEFLRIGRVYEDLLAEAIDDETGGKDPLWSRLYATVLAAGASATFREWMTDEDLDLRVLLDVVDYAETAFGTRHQFLAPPKRAPRRRARGVAG
jgi:AcrR family transcriptional regulator